MPTFKEQLEKITNLQQRLAVWETLHHLLEDSFTSRDGTPAKKAIRVPGSQTEIVQEDIINDVLEFLEENHISEIKGEIAKLESREVETPQGGENN